MFGRSIGVSVLTFVYFLFSYVMDYSLSLTKPSFASEFNVLLKPLPVDGGFCAPAISQNFEVIKDVRLNKVVIEAQEAL